MLSKGEIDTLSKRLRDVQNKSTAEIVVVIISSTQGTPIDEYAKNLFNQWRIGTSEENNGVLFLVVSGESRMRITTGYGMEKYLTNKKCEEIINSIVQKIRSYGVKEGIIYGVNEIALEVSNVYKGPSLKSDLKKSSDICVKKDRDNLNELRSRKKDNNYINMSSKDKYLYDDLKYDKRIYILLNYLAKNHKISVRVNDGYDIYQCKNFCLEGHLSTCPDEGTTSSHYDRQGVDIFEIDGINMSDQISKNIISQKRARKKIIQVLREVMNMPVGIYTVRDPYTGKEVFKNYRYDHQADDYPTLVRIYNEEDAKILHDEWDGKFKKYFPGGNTGIAGIWSCSKKNMFYEVDCDTHIHINY